MNYIFLYKLVEFTNETLLPGALFYKYCSSDNGALIDFEHTHTHRHSTVYASSKMR